MTTATSSAHQPTADARPTVAIVTLGCGRNEVDSDQLVGLLDVTHEVTADATQADVVLVNTCTFIEPAKQESIDTILAAADLKRDDIDGTGDGERNDTDSVSNDTGRDGPSRAKGVVVIGCMAQRYPDQLAESLPEADAIVGFSGYPQLPGLIDDILQGRDHDRVLGIEPSTEPTVMPGRSLPVVHGQSGPSPAQTDGTDTPGLAPTAHDASDAPAGDGPSWMAPVPELAGRAPSNTVIDPLALVDSAQSPASGPLFPPRRSPDAPWANLKIASGCDRLCTFCAIPSFRGRFRSRPIDELVAEAAWLADQGVQELVLVSENTTSYGKDLAGWNGHPGGRSLAPLLLEALADVDGIHRLRAMYLQPAELREDLLTAIAGIPEVASYFDLSLQHVSSTVLRRMARSGSPERFGALIQRIRALAPDAAIRSNFILGFPGETDEDVDALCTFLATHQLDFVGLFTYSDEDGTAAVDLDGHVDPAEAHARLEQVASVVERASGARARARVGDDVTVVVEHVSDNEVAGRSHREAPETDGDVTLVTAQGTPVTDVAVGQRIRARVVEAVGVDLIATPVRRTPVDAAAVAGTAETDVDEVSGSQ